MMNLSRDGVGESGEPHAGEGFQTREQPAEASRGWGGLCLQTAPAEGQVCAPSRGAPLWLLLSTDCWGPEEGEDWAGHGPQGGCGGMSWARCWRGPRSLAMCVDLLGICFLNSPLSSSPFLRIWTCFEVNHEDFLVGSQWSARESSLGVLHLGV